VKRLPVSCPSCDGKLTVKQLLCDKCQTEVEGLYPLPPLAALTSEDQDFIIEFIKASGSLKEMATLLKVSYPTVRNRLDDIIGKLKRSESRDKK